MLHKWYMMKCFCYILKSFIMFTRFKFYNLTTIVIDRGKCFGGVDADVRATNESNEKIAEATNATNVSMNEATNAANIQMNAENNQLQQKLQDDMNSFNEMMWQKNNEYNSPEEQIKRGRDAGLNPNSVLGNVVASQPVQQVSTPPTTPGTAVPGHIDPYQLQTPRFNAMDLVERFLGDVQGAADLQTKLLGNENLSYQNDFAPAMLASKLRGSNIQNELGKQNIKNVSQDTILKMRQSEGIAQQISESRQKVRNMQMEWNSLSEDVYKKSVDNAFAFVLNEANLKSINASTGEKESNIKYLANKMRCESMYTYAQVNNLNWHSNVLKLEARGRQEFLDSGGTLKQIEQMDAATQVYLSNKTGQDLTNDITRQTGKYTVQKARAEADAADYNNSTFVRALDACDKIGSVVQKVGTGVGSAANGLKPGVSINTNDGWVSTPTGRNPYE